jgi:hypothetical protein
MPCHQSSLSALGHASSYSTTCRHHRVPGHSMQLLNTAGRGSQFTPDMSRKADFGVDAAATFAAKLLPSQHPKFCRLQNASNSSRQKLKMFFAPSTASSAPISPDFLQMMRVKMIQAFIDSEHESKVPQDMPLAPPPTLDRVLLHRATLKSRKLRLFSGQVPEAQPDSANIWHDPILVAFPPLPPSH